VLVDNCCTSYAIPTAIVVYKDGRKTVISPGQMIYEWPSSRAVGVLRYCPGPSTAGHQQPVFTGYVGESCWWHGLVMVKFPIGHWGGSSSFENRGEPKSL
jgi:hypothetical protein